MTEGRRALWKEGREEHGDAFVRAGEFTFADPDLVDEGGSGDSRPRRGTTLAMTLDAAGGARATVKDVETSDQPQDLVAELEYRDPNGQTLTSSTRVALWPSKVLLGIKPDGWAASKDRFDLVRMTGTSTRAAPCRARSASNSSIHAGMT